MGNRRRVMKKMLKARGLKLKDLETVKSKSGKLLSKVVSIINTYKLSRGKIK